MKKTAFITGATSGIGEALARRWAAQGINLILNGRSPEKLEKLCSELSSASGAFVHPFLCDVKNKEAVQQAFEALPSEMHTIHTLVNNAGLARGLEGLSEGKTEEWDEVIDTNIKGVLYITRLVLPGMLKRQEGDVVFVGSIAGHRTYVGGNVYCATKHAIAALARGLKKECDGSRIRVMSIDPGAVKTNFSVTRFRGDKETADKVYEKMEPLTPLDIAHLIDFCVGLPSHINVNELIVTATDQPSLL